MPKSPVVFSVIFLSVIVLVAFLSKSSEQTGQYSRPFIKKIRAIVEQAQKWSSLAKQDTKAVVQLIHCDYALAYCQLARTLATANDILQITGLDINELCEYMQDCQNSAIQNIGNQAPQLKLDSMFSLSGWT